VTSEQGSCITRTCCVCRREWYPTGSKGLSILLEHDQYFYRPNKFYRCYCSFFRMQYLFCFAKYLMVKENRYG
jgi:hypothetical protein